MSEDAEEIEDAWSMALGKAIDRVFVKKEHTPFNQLVESFRAIESDIVSRFMGNESLVMNTRRRIAEMILITAIDKELPFEACRTLWGNVIELGFIDLEDACFPSWYYANLCCLPNRQIEDGIRALEPVINELTRTLSDPALPETARSFYGEERQRLQTVLDTLRVQRDA